MLKAEFLHLFLIILYNKQKRINRLNIKVEDAIITDNDSTKDNYIIIAIDSIGVKVTNRGHQWIRDKWIIRKEGYLKNNIAVVDVKTNK